MSSIIQNNTIYLTPTADEEKEEESQQKRKSLMIAATTFATTTQQVPTTQALQTIWSQTIKIREEFPKISSTNSNKDKRVLAGIVGIGRMRLEVQQKQQQQQEDEEEEPSAAVVMLTFDPEFLQSLHSVFKLHVFPTALRHGFNSLRYCSPSFSFFLSLYIYISIYLCV